VAVEHVPSRQVPSLFSSLKQDEPLGVMLTMVQTPPKHRPDEQGVPVSQLRPSSAKPEQVTRAVGVCVVARGEALVIVVKFSMQRPC
jgi:hypothetical protein